MHLRAAIASWMLLASVAPAAATPLTHEGLTFSDEAGGFRLLSVIGTGTLADPIVVTEEITGSQDAVLLIRGFSREFGNRIGSHHIAAFAMTKVVINRTDKVWQNFQMELREVPTRHSPYEDGLSFGQNSQISAAYTSSSFPDSQRFDEPEDTLGFSGAQVPPGGTATFRFIVSDMSPTAKFYLFQEPLQPLSRLAPAPAGATQSAGR